MTVRCQTPVPGADVRGGAGGRPASASPSRARSRLKPFPSVCPQRRSRANGHVHSAQQHPGTSQSRGAARRVPGREESEASEAAHGADPGKKPQRRAAPQARVAAVDVTLRLDRFPLRGSRTSARCRVCVCVCVRNPRGMVAFPHSAVNTHFPRFQKRRHPQSWPPVLSSDSTFRGWCGTASPRASCVRLVPSSTLA